MLLTGKNKMASITEEQAEKHLIEIVTKYSQHLDKHLPWWIELSVDRQMALLNLTYNLGIDKLMKFKKMLTSLQNGDYDKAGDHLLQGSSQGKSKYYTQVGVRAVHVSDALKYGEWNYQQIYSYYT
jgi:lysozyme